MTYNKKITIFRYIDILENIFSITLRRFELQSKSVTALSEGKDVIQWHFNFQKVILYDLITVCGYWE